MLLGVDVGGTFTDAVLVADDGTVYSTKVPSTPERESAGVLAAIDALLADAGAKGSQVRRFAHGMTVATNALLEGRTARTALVATAGFTDVLEIGRQARPNLYRLSERAATPLVPAELRFGARERMTPAGPLVELTVVEAEAVAAGVAAADPEAVAVALLHSYADASHERLIGDVLARILPGVTVSLSSEAVGTFREYERTATTVVDAALSPALAGYLGDLATAARGQDLPDPLIMQSSGGLTGHLDATAHAAVTVLSGPAGGVGGAGLLAEGRSVLCFDMGGTSCDVCLIADGEVAETAERVIAGRPVALPSLDIQTVGAGGGSIAWRDSGGALRVGPQSAGAVPGPACYGRGGALPTVTDANLTLGRLAAGAPLAGSTTLDPALARDAVAALADEAGIGVVACAERIVQLAEAEMLSALRVMTIERGIDPRPFSLLPFGGAGPLHAAALAEELGIERMLCPRASGVLSALGLAAAAPRRDVSRSVMLRGRGFSQENLDRERDALLHTARASLGEPAARSRVRYEIRYAGQSFELAVDEHLTVDAPRLSVRALAARFADAHEHRYGYRDGEAEAELVTLRASVWGEGPPLQTRGGTGARPLREEHELVIDATPVSCPLIRGEPLPGERVEGPALVALPHATLLVRPGWRGEADERGTILLERR